MSDGRTLAQLYDGDLYHRDPVAASLRRRVFIPHPLTGVEYGDGRIEDTTAGHVKCFGCPRCEGRRGRR